MRILRVSSCFCLQDPLLFLGKKIPSYYQPTETFMRGWRKEKEMKRARKKKKESFEESWDPPPLSSPRKERKRERADGSDNQIFLPSLFLFFFFFRPRRCFPFFLPFFWKGGKFYGAIRHPLPPSLFKNKQRNVTKSESLFLFLWPEMKFPVPFFHCPGATAVSSARGSRRG